MTQANEKNLIIQKPVLRIRIRDRFFLDPGSQPHISGSFVIIFGVKILKFFANNWLSLPFLFLLDPATGYGMEKNPDPG